jgi:hypothetical protein
MKRTNRCIAVVVTLMMLLAMSTAGVVFAGGTAAGPPGGGTSSGGVGAGPGGGGGDGAGAGGGVGAAAGVGGGGAKTSTFLTPEQEYTLDTFNACAGSYAGAVIDGLAFDGGFSFSTRSLSDANGIRDCMAKQGFKFSR